jgi:hypothetical protein
LWDAARFTDLGISFYAAATVQATTQRRVTKRRLDLVPIITLQVLPSLDPIWKRGERNEEAKGRAQRLLADLARCVFGNPFRPVVIDRARIANKYSAVGQMALAIYEERARSTACRSCPTRWRRPAAPTRESSSIAAKTDSTPAAVGSWTPYWEKGECRVS